MATPKNCMKQTAMQDSSRKLSCKIQPLKFVVDKYSSADVSII